MKYMKYLFVPIIVICSLKIYAAEKIGLTKEIYTNLCGVWETRKVVGDEVTLSWGKANMVINGSIVIDLGEDRPFLFAGPMGESDIINVYRKKDDY